MESRSESGRQPDPPKSNTPEAASALSRAQDGDEDALRQFIDAPDIIFVNDMPENLAKAAAGETKKPNEPSMG